MSASGQSAARKQKDHGLGAEAQSDVLKSQGQSAKVLALKSGCPILEEHLEERELKDFLDEMRRVVPWSRLIALIAHPSEG